MCQSRMSMPKFREMRLTIKIKTMKKSIKLGVVALLFAAACVGCTKYHEEITDRPNFDVEIPANPPWDSIPQPNIPIGK